ncbi:drug/metabolite transporter (DMT)-like permease [Paenibacillus qinlingensis]|uniref:Drug/metabolite transporter (DMT)-like permease n=1 Tax=Paenibacillus qinlingensis TaxID=1837343 RepID=A0ABU1NNU8_9BACL|nr:drug/metabolite transporter (DMT)-like permease [Paenibacillus qinlingensis]
MLLAALRLTLSIIVLLIYGLFTRKLVRVSLKDWKQLVPLGITAVLIHHGTFFIGLKETDATTAALIIALVPMTTAILAAFFLKEPITVRIALGSILALFGVYLVIGFGKGIQLNREIGMIFISMVAFSVSIIQTKKIANRINPFVITVYSTAVGTSMLYPVVILVEPVIHASEQLWAWGLLLLSAVVIQAICSLIWAYQVKAVGASRAATYINLEPFIAMLVGFLLLGTSVNLAQMVGSVVLVVGVTLVTSHKRGKKVKRERDLVS